MNAAEVIAAVVVPVLTALHLLRGLFQRAPRQLPPQVDDGVAVTRLDTEAIAHPTAERLRREWRRETAGLVLFVAFLVVALPVTRSTSQVLFVAIVTEAVLVVPTMAYRVTTHRDLRPHEPANRFSVQLQVVGRLDALASRLRRAFLEMRAVGVIGSSISTSDARFVIEGGTGLWGTTGNEGYLVRVTALRTDECWEVTVESMNYVPSLLQGFRNERNVARLVGRLLA